MVKHVIVLGGLGLALLGALSFEAVAQSSCSGWKATCESRCKRADCGGICVQKKNECMATGCWTEVPRNGGKQHCNLKKS
jgi:hypothetical protein